MVKGEVDEKNVEEELSKIKERLAARHAEREQKRTNGQTRSADDDFFDEVPLNGRPALSDDEMDIDDTPRPAARNRKRSQAVSDDEDIPVANKRQRTLPAKTTKVPPRGRQRQASDSSEAPSLKKNPARKVAARSKVPSNKRYRLTAYGRGK